MEIPLQLPRDKVTIWDEHAPIVKQKEDNYIVYLTDALEEPSYYNKLVHLLNEATEKTTFSFVINCGGGVVYTAVMIVDAMRNSKAKIHTHCTGIIASAATVIALQSDTLTIADHSAFMIHNYSSGVSGKGGEIEAQQKFMTKNLKRAFSTYYQGFLTSREITSVIGDKDKWLSAEDVRERWNNKLSTKRK